MKNNSKKKFEFSDKTKLLLLSFLIALGLWSSVAAGSLPVRVSEQVEVLQVNGQATGTTRSRQRLWKLLTKCHS